MKTKHPQLKYLVVIPTVRQQLPGFDAVMERVRSTLTHPTDLHILDGRPNKPETLNRAYDELLTPSDCDVYVTMDDDWWPGNGWQDTIAAAMAALPNVGVFGIWLGPSPAMTEYMGRPDLIAPAKEKDGVRYRMLIPPHHVAGAMIAFRREAALAVGKQPSSDLNYQIWEDFWRGRRARKAGWEHAYLLGEETPRIIEYPDPPEYLDQKARDLAAGMPQVDTYMAMGGVKDPFLFRVRAIIKKRLNHILGR